MSACRIHLTLHSETAAIESSSDLRLVRYSRLFLALAFYLALFGVCCAAIASADTWWHLATGRWIVDHHAIPHTDPFSFATAGKPWVAHEYLTDILMYFIHRGGGMIALATANALLLTSAFAIVANSARSPRWFAFACALFAAFAARPAFALRPQSISLVFGAAFLWVLRKFLSSHQPRWLVVLPCLMLLWVQLHAGYLLGIGFIVLFLAAESLDALIHRTATQPRELLLLLASAIACTAVVPLNPNGFTMLTFPFRVMRMKINHTILEWQPPNLHDHHLYPFLALAGLTLVSLVVSKQKYRPGQFLIYAALLAAALRSARNIPVFCLVAVLLSADHAWLPSSSALSRLSGPIRVTAAAALLVLAGYFCADAASAGLAFQALAEKNVYPRAAVTYLADHHLQPNVLNDYTFGGYMIWRLFPAYKVYVDGRADLYGDEFLAKYVDIYNGEDDPRPFLDQNRINTVILSPSAGLTTILRMLTVRGGWQIEYEDPKAVIFVRSPQNSFPQ